jgi:DNA adenine methylase
MKITSPLRYPGGKSKALGKILPLIPLDFAEYREPFIGGGSVFIALKQLRPEAKYRINDLNHDLYCFWINVKNSVDDLVGEVTRIRDTCKDGRTLYDKLIHSNRGLDEFDRAVRFYILNRITYSGTVDSGGYSAAAFEKRFTSSNVDKLKPLSTLLRGVEITNDSYERLLARHGRDVFVFMDPPYWKSKKHALYGENGNLNKSFNHEYFAENARKCVHRWLVTFDDSDLIRRLFRFARKISAWEMRYGMTNTHGNRTAKGRELFISNYRLD